MAEECAEVSEEWLLVFLDVFEGLIQALLLHKPMGRINVLIASSQKACFKQALHHYRELSLGLSFTLFTRMDSPRMVIGFSHFQP